MTFRRSLATALPLAALLTSAACAAKPPAHEEPAHAAKPAALELPNGHGEGDVLTAGQPTLAQLAAAKALGYRTVVNLRMPEEPGTESEADVTKLGLRYVAIPMNHEAGLTEANARALADALAGPEGRPAIVHCGSANRAGALFALEAFYVRGRSAADALEVGKRLGLTKLEPAVRAMLEKAEAERKR